MAKKKSLATTFLIAIILSGIAFAVGVPQTKAVSKTIVVPDDYSTIQKAIGFAAAGDTVFVRKGIYNGTAIQPITIHKPLSLIGEDPSTTKILGFTLSYGGPPPVIVVDAENVTISGFTISKYGNGVEVGSGIQINYKGNNSRILNNIVTGLNGGIGTEGLNDLSTGFTVMSNITISNNTVTNNQYYGIYCATSNTTISDNIVSGNGLGGIVIDSATNVTVSENTIAGNGISNTVNDTGGLDLRWWGPFNVYRNVIEDNRGYGIQFGEGCYNSTVVGNSIQRNLIGINLLNFPIGGDATLGFGNKVYSNNLINNSKQATVETQYRYYNENSTQTYANGTDSVSWDNTKEGNYWSDYSTKYPNATEIDSTGIRNTPYLIDTSNIDHYPLTKTVAIPEFPSWIILPIVIMGILLTFVFAKRKMGKI